MKPMRRVGAWVYLAVGFGSFAIALNAHAQAGSNEIRVEMAENVVELSTDRGNRWLRIQTNQVLRAGDRLRTGSRSRAALRVSASTVLSFPELTEIEIVPPGAPALPPGLHIFRGLFSYFHKGKPERVKVTSPSSVAGVDGTEFVISVDTNKLTTLAVIDGVVSFGNGTDTPITLTNGERAIVEVGGRPAPIAGFVANNLLQWAFYYPAVLDPRDLEFSADEEQALRESLTAYHQGDLLAALDAYGTRTPTSDAERIYHAALLLAVGQVSQTSDALAQIDQANASERNRRLAAALRLQIAAVKRELVAAATKPERTTELLAASYYEQSRAGGDETLKRALDLARRATTNSAEFGFAWARVAELEFSFGRNAKAKEALNKSLALSPRNAQALALNGFLFAAQNNPREAIGWFDRAIAADAALANAWLGRGLCRIRRGDRAGGENDLLIAAALEPRRAQLRNYLGKAYAESNERDRALHELDLAKGIDPNDPTAWLYSALLKAEHNRINEAIRDLERSQELNENRNVYRSSLLLDQDRSVRSANLARIYEDAGMTDWSVHEAARAISYDYGNFSAHLFLANSYNALRDPNRINLRYDTPAGSEYLIANLLAPVGAGTLSPSISQQEYSNLFERDRFGVVSTTEYLSRGAWTQSGAQFGTFRHSTYSVEAFYRTDPGQRPNNDFEQRTLSAQFKHQFTPKDTAFFRVSEERATGGDLSQYSDQTNSNLGLRTEERQEPIASIGYHREWAPGMHTLVLGSRLDDRIGVDNPRQETLMVNRTSRGYRYVEFMNVNQIYRSTLEIYSAEAQQIWQKPGRNTIVGMLLQAGDFHTKNAQHHPSVNVADLFPPNGVTQESTTDFHRLSAYGYHHQRVFDSLLVVAGVSYDRMTFPRNFRAAPISNDEETVDRVSPKAGFIWTPGTNTALRAAYTRSLSGASIDQSARLEPTQVAGFNQSFRSITPESISGSDAGARFETYGASIEHRFPTETYVSLKGEILNSEIKRTFGVFQLDLSSFAYASGMREHIDFREQAIVLTVDQLLGDGWSLGGRYRLSDADLTDEFVEVNPRQQPPPNLVPPFQPKQHLTAVLHQVDLHAIYNHPSGFFAQFQALWYGQSNEGYSPDIGDDVWQFNILAGYRSPQRKVEITLGLLNLTDQDYRLNPLTLYSELPREITFVARLRLSF